MQVVTVRLDEELVEDLEDEADDRGVTRTEYVRNLLRNRDRIRENTGEYAEENTREYERIRENTPENTSVYGDLEERLADLESRVEDLEGGGDAIAPTPLASDAPNADVEPSEVVVDALEASGWSHGRNREERERNAAVAAWALEVLRGHDRECRRSDVPLDALDDDRKADTIWHRVVRPAILAVAEATDAVETSTNDQRYRWVGE
jgi:hypothetical protein